MGRSPWGFNRGFVAVRFRGLTVSFRPPAVRLSTPNRPFGQGASRGVNKMAKAVRDGEASGHLTGAGQLRTVQGSACLHQSRHSGKDN